MLPPPVFIYRLHGNARGTLIQACGTSANGINATEMLDEGKPDEVDQYALWPKESWRMRSAVRI